MSLLPVGTCRYVFLRGSGLRAGSVLGGTSQYCPSHMNPELFEVSVIPAF
jgi:hypothetical protein